MCSRPSHRIEGTQTQRNPDGTGSTLASVFTRNRRSDASLPKLIDKGLDVPIAGAPDQDTAAERKAVGTVAVVGPDYNGLRPHLLVEPGETVKLGQALFADRHDERIVFSAPGGGRVTEINRGARRALISVVIELDGEDEQDFPSWQSGELPALRRDQIVDTLLAAGLWPALRTRPYSNIADPAHPPASIFVTATDSNPLATRPETVIEQQREDFANGMTVISRLTDGPVFLCHAPFTNPPAGDAPNVAPVQFAGPHPSGLVGTHINFLDPVHANKTVWHLGYQDVIAIGKLFTTGRLWVERMVSLAGPAVIRPRLIRTRLGAGIGDLVRGELRDGVNRVISGSVLSGRWISGADGYLGRYHNQISVIAEAEEVPKRGAFTTYRLGVTSQPRQKLDMTTARHGGPGPLVPLGGYERVMPLDILPTPLLRALLVGDSDMAQALGCLELDEEDLALCAFVCPAKLDHGGLLRAMLTRIEKEG